MKPLRETDIVRACLDWLHYKRILAWRSNSGAVVGVYKGKKRFVRFNRMPGLSDICAVLPGGRFVAIEVKRPGGKMTLDQVGFLEQVKKAGGIGIVVHSTDELADALIPF